MTGVKALRTVDRAFATLDVLADRQPIGVTDLARAMQLDKSATQRVLVSLQQAGWIRSDGSVPIRWVLTTKPLRLARQVTGSWLVSHARPVLERLCAASGETVLLGVVDGQQIVVVDGAESDRALRASVRRGLVLPGPTSASSKAILAALEEARWGELMPEQPTPQLRVEVARARKLGYASNIGEVDPGIHAVAAVVTSPDGRPTAALVVCGPASRLTASALAEAGRLAAGHAAELSAMIC